MKSKFKIAALLGMLTQPLSAEPLIGFLDGSDAPDLLDFGVPENAENTKIMTFIRSLNLVYDSRTDTANNEYYFHLAPKYHLSEGQYPVSITPHTEVVDLNGQIKKWNKRVSTVLDAKADELFASGGNFDGFPSDFNGNLNAATEMIETNEPVSDIEKEEPATNWSDSDTKDAAEAFSNTAVDFLTPEQERLYIAGIHQAHVALGFRIVPEPTIADIWASIARAQRFWAADFSMKIVRGLDEQQIQMLRKYQSLLLDKGVTVKVKSFPAPNTATLHFDSVTRKKVDKFGNQIHARPADLDMFGSDIFANGSLEIPATGGVILFKLSQRGYNSIQFASSQQRPLLLPINVSTDVKGYSRVNAKVKCQFDDTMRGWITASQTKYSNKDYFAPVLDYPRFTAGYEGDCKIVTSDSQALREDDYAVLRDAESRFKREFASIRNASEDLRSQWVQSVVMQTQNQFSDAMPEKWRKRFRLATTTQCRQVLTTRQCGVSVSWSGIKARHCLRTHTACSEVHKVLTDYYKTKSPVWVGKSKYVNEDLSISREYDFVKDHLVEASYTGSADVCIKFTGEDQQPGISCSIAERDTAHSSHSVERLPQGNQVNDF